MAAPDASRPPHSGSPFHVAPWEWTLGCGLLKILLAGLAFAMPFFVPHLIPPTVGWMLVAGGVSELALSWRGRESWVGRLTFLSGAVTVLAGVLFISGRWNGLFPLVQYVTIWLLLRGLVAFDIGIQSRSTPTANWVWLLIRGGVDIALSVLLLIGAPLTMFTIAVLGETREILVLFCRLIAISFAVGGLSFVAIALAQRRWHRRDPFLIGGGDA